MKDDKRGDSLEYTAAAGAEAMSDGLSRAGTSFAEQPVLGILALAASMALSMGIIGLLDAELFATWVTFFVVVCVPVQVILSMAWELNYPPLSRKLKQPLKGAFFMALMLLVAGAIAVTVYYAQPVHAGPPTPFVLMYVIFCVLVTFWFVIVWNCWPLSSLLDNRLLMGLGILAVAYGGGYGLFTLLFDFHAMSAAPFYSAAMDPGGAFSAFHVLAYSVTTVSVVFFCLLFDFWPLTLFPVLRIQPLMGLVSTIYILGLSAAVYWMGVEWLDMEPVKLMVNVSIGFLFGSLIPLIMFEGKLFGNLRQPWKGIAQCAVAVIAAVTLPSIYWELAPLVSGPLNSGAPGYQYEFWMASALLAMTFPIMVVVGKFLDFWPLRFAPIR